MKCSKLTTMYQPTEGYPYAAAVALSSKEAQAVAQDINRLGQYTDLPDLYSFVFDLLETMGLKDVDGKLEFDK